MAQQKKKLFESYKSKLANFASDADIRRCLNCGPDKIMKYAELKDFDCLSKLLPKVDFDYVVILIEEKLNSGHWTCVVRRGKTFTLFDSYGTGIDKELGFVGAGIKRLLGEDEPFISKMLRECSCNADVIDNRTQFQSLKPDVATCGRWTVIFIEMSKMGYSLDEFRNFVFTAAENSSKPTDLLVCDWIPLEKDIPLTTSATSAR